MPITAEQRERVERWLAALRSEEYPQTHSGYMRDAVGYCGLGVAADVADVGAWAKACHDGREFYDFKPHPDLPEDQRSLRGLYGLTSRQCDDLCYMNDFEKLTLRQIADRIDATFGLTTEED